MSNFIPCFFSVFFIFCIISQVDSAVDVECNTGQYIAAICKLTGVTETTTVTRVVAEYPGKDCIEDVTYRFTYMRDGTGWIVAFYGCGGTFRVTNDVTPTWRSWGVWSACSSSCGKGTKSRTRTCSTGVKSDCITAQGNAENELTHCNSGSCSKTPASIDAICSRRNLDYRILGGTRAEKCEFPWMVMFYNTRHRLFCGGSIIDQNHILTAAHCVNSGYYTANPSDIIVVSGANLKPSLYSVKYGTPLNRQYPFMRFRYVSSIKVHEQFDRDTLNSDVAIVTLTEPIVFDKCHEPVCLPKDSPTTFTGCKVMGWGTTSNGYFARISPQLLYATVNVASRYTCERIYSHIYFDARRQICVGGNGKGSCKGDSGGPLVCPGPDGRYYQYGVVSGGASHRCGNTASFYTRVTNYLAWIKTNTAN